MGRGWRDGHVGDNGPPHSDELTTLPDPDNQTYNPQNSLPYQHHEARTDPDRIPQGRALPHDPRAKAKGKRKKRH